LEPICNGRGHEKGRQMRGEKGARNG